MFFLPYRALPAAGIPLAVLLFCAFAACAQQLRVGVRGGGSLTNGIGADANGSSFRFGYHGGAVVQLRATERWSLQPEVLYTLKGDAAEAYGPAINAGLTYLEAPVLLRYLRDDAFIEAGPYAAYRLRTSYNDNDVQLSGISPYQQADYGLVFGFGYQDPQGLSVGWRYVTGLRNIYRPVAFADALEHVRLRNSSIQLSFAYLLPWAWGKPR
ncbi:porin family protein [Hymenobacter sp. CRA2]|uniref:porin family protein n=1 Tax=Hymenobacter sp. CRA2 TaxID=1955620 RepID=UPI0009D4E462|nr:porin family protein [Hymenobacter sp. CRA2]OON70529.1 hypothetical protein B0919_00425 [Hymenobacter sp. CRA2]